jgi:3-methyladenine DNA glycosylase AlkD
MPSAPARRLHDELRAALLERATPAQKASAEAYLKGRLAFWGCKGPDVVALFKARLPDLLALPDAEDLGFHLLGQEHAEEQTLGVLTLNRLRKKLSPGVVARVEPPFDARAGNWGTCDAICARILRWRLPDDTERARLVAWSAHPSPWRRRAACVAFVNEACKGLYGEDIGRVVPAALALDHRFAQLGAGWLLRQRWLAAPAEVERYLREHGRAMRREAVRYAIEKMPKALQADLLAATAR